MFRFKRSQYFYRCNAEYAARKASLNKFDNSPKCFLTYLTEFPKQGARAACWLSLVTWALTTGGQIAAQTSVLGACSAQFMWPVNEGKHRKEFSNSGSRTQSHWKRSWASKFYFQLSTRMSPGSDLIFAPIVSYVFQHIPFQYTSPQNSVNVYLSSKLHVQSIATCT